MLAKFFLIVMSINSFLFSCMYADMRNSNTAVSIESFFTFPESSGTANCMKAFGWFRNGFALTNAQTVCTLVSVFPPSGTVDLRRGMFTLEPDMLFQDVTALQSLGTIVDNNYLVDFSSSVTYVPLAGVIKEKLS